MMIWFLKSINIRVDLLVLNKIPNSFLICPLVFWDIFPKIEESNMDNRDYLSIGRLSLLFQKFQLTAL